MSRLNARQTHGRMAGYGALSVTLLLLIASQANAGEDGGARSVFATGAGNRALAAGIPDWSGTSSWPAERTSTGWASRSSTSPLPCRAGDGEPWHSRCATSG
jgi:hypothetical protein